jgi:hypothetical protein
MHANILLFTNDNLGEKKKSVGAQPLSTDPDTGILKPGKIEKLEFRVWLQELRNFP